LETRLLSTDSETVMGKDRFRDCDYVIAHGL
jgi:hypothetical protein